MASCELSTRCHVGFTASSILGLGFRYPRELQRGILLGRL
jgi:hypothetical protein